MKAEATDVVHGASAHDVTLFDGTATTGSYEPMAPGPDAAAAPPPPLPASSAPMPGPTRTSPRRAGRRASTAASEPASSAIVGSARALGALGRSRRTTHTTSASPTASAQATSASGTVKMIMPAGGPTKKKGRSGKRASTGAPRGRSKGGCCVAPAHAFMYACYKNQRLIKGRKLTEVYGRSTNCLWRVTRTFLERMLAVPKIKNARIITETPSGFKFDIERLQMLLGKLSWERFQEYFGV
ncbi:hypothetical protein ABPG75_001880 [Micractinium tetrahymenae]